MARWDVFWGQRAFPGVLTPLPAAGRPSISQRASWASWAFDFSLGKWAWEPHLTVSSRDSEATQGKGHTQVCAPGLVAPSPTVLF